MTRRAQSPVLIEATPKRQEILPTMTRLAGSGLSVTFVQALCKLTLASALAEERSTQTQHDPLLGKLCIYILSRRGKRKKYFDKTSEASIILNFPFYTDFFLNTFMHPKLI